MLLIYRFDLSDVFCTTQFSPLSVFLAAFAQLTTHQEDQRQGAAAVVGGTHKTALCVSTLSEIERPWKKLLVPGILQHRAAIECVYKRNELSQAWIYPAVSEEDQVIGVELLQVLNEAVAHNGYDAMDVPLAMVVEKEEMD